ncbi:FRG domain-containing protein [Candidatus Methylomirabilis sp.]|uniref:FRG domain-containing protein n=1 Tax=Candidatus Methylomirabilis sp. TaxID=2032687 RepID=UPI003076180E
MPCVKEVLVEDWASYQDEVDQILENFEARRSTTSKGLVSAPLFRGQSNQSWPPLTTLERFSAKSWSIKRYHRLLQSVGPAVFSLTSKAWNLGEDPDNVDQSRHIPPPAYEFMIYLRHYGFPSPLLDWSRSPYVAAFFAFEHQPDCEAVAVYVFQEYLGYPKLFSGDGASIIGLGSYVITHERHYAQLCEYTICKKPVDKDYVYCNHEEALRDRVVPQDSLRQYIIPVTERQSFLRKRESMNIHAYSLFRDETSLMQTLAYREIEQDDL